MKKNNLPNLLKARIGQRFILVLGALLGFSTSIVAQYGAPMANYKVSGTILSKTCEEPIPGIKITARTNPYYKEYGSVFYTDSFGHFEYTFLSDDWSQELKILVTAQDTDGVMNKGDFLPFEKYIVAERSSYYGNEKNNNPKTQIIKMLYSGKPPCGNEIPQDTVIQLPLIKLNDSTTIEPGKVADIYEQLTDTAEIIAPPVGQLENVFIVFPNPSQGIYYIHINSFKNSLVTSYVYDATSKMILYNKWNKEQGLFEETIDISSFSPGTYYLVVFSDKEKYMKKLIKE